MSDETPILPAHIEETIHAIARLHAEHYQQASPLQRIVDRTTAFVGRPRFIAWLTAFLTAWLLLNLIASGAGLPSWDPPPFNWLQGLVSLVALYTTVLILATQRREDQLAGHREQLTLELGILSEQKSAKIIQLLEELRRDTPFLSNRIDPEAVAMSMPTDPQSVLDAIKESHEDLETMDLDRGSAAAL